MSFTQAEILEEFVEAAQLMRYRPRQRVDGFWRPPPRIALYKIDLRRLVPRSDRPIPFLLNPDAPPIVLLPPRPGGPPPRPIPFAVNMNPTPRRKRTEA